MKKIILFATAAIVIFTSRADTTENQKETNDMAPPAAQGENKSKFDEVKYVNMEPARAVAYNFVSREPEGEVLRVVFEWLEKNNLKGVARIYLFNTEPYPTKENPEYGMGCCATIPEGIEIPEPLYEKRLPGGTYAVISDYEGDPSHGWKKIGALLDDKDWEWEYDGRGGCRGLEEHIERPDGGLVIPVMLPVKKKEKKDE